MDGDGQISTPLLQLVMQSIWEQERAESSTVLRRTTLEEKLHGAESILDGHLTKALATLGGPEERQTAIDVLDQLATDSGPKIARTVPALADRTRHSEQQLTAVLEQLDKEYIVRSVEAPPGKDRVRFRRYEIFHDVLAPAINRVVQSQIADRLRHERNAAVRRAAIIGGLAVLTLSRWRSPSSGHSRQATRVTAHAARHAATSPTRSRSRPKSSLDPPDSRHPARTEVLRVGSIG